ncbi:tryptophan dimethylallyltransferase family protein [Archangium lipolyticum]|uniref:tryptophan dimethylallyltransferase family protein n=1 Tax=Archangium lipolyticum TaxID=2970465 RepID=UPI00214A6000|nr:tryptophan dimethylallyltransferase family protein [Archangium lipolyticum]
MQARARIASQTFHAFGSAKLTAMCRAVGFTEEDTRTVLKFFELLTSPWGQRRIGTEPVWASDITDDHSPYELSLALDGRTPEVRFLVEAQGEPTTLQSSWVDGLALCERLRRHSGITLDRLERVRELFEPRNPGASFSLWHAFGLKAGGKPDFKVYLNPLARGPGQESELTREALDRLGFTGSWRFISQEVMRRGPKDRLVYFSLDLSAGPAARVKLYVAHQDATVEDLEEVLSRGGEYMPGEPRSFCRALSGGEGPFTARPPLTCFAFTSDNAARPFSSTLHFPLRAYVVDDLHSVRAIRQILEPRDRGLFEQVLAAISDRPLEAGRGLVQWASLRHQRRQARTTFYLAPEAYGATTTRPHMNRVLEYIDTKKQELARLPLFAFVEDRSIDPRQRLGFAPCLAPMTMGFSDLMRFGLRDLSSRDEIQRILNAHTTVDEQHWEYFMRDVETLGVNGRVDLVDSLSLLWGDHCAKTRQLINKLMSMVREATPILRLVILEAVEAASDVGFSRFRQAGREFTAQTGKPLYYFGQPHQDLEDAHEKMGGQGIRAVISSHTWTPEEEQRALSLVDEVNTHFAGMGEDLLAYALKAREAGPLWPLTLGLRLVR